MKKFTRSKLNVQARSSRRLYCLLSLLVLVPCPRVCADAASSQVAALRELETRIKTVVAACKPAFVFIKGDQERGYSSGSGFCISPDGYVLTNDHVIAGARSVQAYMTGGRFFKTTVVGRDPGGDVALLKLQGGEKFPFLELGDSQGLRPGQRVLALGDPFLTGSESIFDPGAPANFEPAVSMGIVSAVHRYSETYNDAIQVDLAVNRGNSGGPLITLDGKAVGINGKIETRFALGINTGVGYAVPSNQIARFMKYLKSAEGGVILHGKIEGLIVGERADEKSGLPVTGVRQGSPAAASGFKVGDLLGSLGGLPVRTRSRYMGILGTYPAGESIGVEVLRAGGKLELEAVLVAGGKAHLGIKPRVVSGDVEGVEVGTVERSTSAQRAGIKEGDVITMFDGEAVASSTDLKRLMNRRRPGDTVVLRISRSGEVLELEVTLGGK